MGLFNKKKKKAGGTGLGNFLRKAVGVAQGIAGVDLGLGTGANKVEKGQKHTNKAIAENPGLYVTPGEVYTNAEIDANPDLGKGFYLDKSSQTPILPEVVVKSTKSPLQNAIDSVKNTINNAKETVDNSATLTKMAKWMLPVLAVVFGVSVIYAVFFMPRRRR